MLLEEPGNPGLANLKSADDKGEMLNHIKRRWEVLSTDVTYVINRLELFLGVKILLHGSANALVMR